MKMGLKAGAAYHAAALDLRRDSMALTFFDSLHAAVSIIEAARC